MYWLCSITAAAVGSWCATSAASTRCSCHASTRRSRASSASASTATRTSRTATSAASCATSPFFRWVSPSHPTSPPLVPSPYPLTAYPCVLCLVGWFGYECGAALCGPSSAGGVAGPAHRVEGRPRPRRRQRAEDGGPHGEPAGDENETLAQPYRYGNKTFAHGKKGPWKGGETRIPIGRKWLETCIDCVSLHFHLFCELT